MRKLLLVGLIFLLLIGLVSGASLSDIPESDIIAVYNLADLTEEKSTYGPLTNNNGVSFVAGGVLGDRADFIKSNSQMLNGSNGNNWPRMALTNGSYSVCFWAQFDDTVTAPIVSMHDGSDHSGGYSFYPTGDSSYIWVHSTGTANNWNTGWMPSSSTQYHVCNVYNTDDNLRLLFVDGVHQGNISTTADLADDGDDNLEIGKYSASYLDGKIEQLVFIDDALDYDQVSELYNGGSGSAYPWSTSNVSINDSTESTAVVKQVGTVSFANAMTTIISSDFNVSVNNSPIYGGYNFNIVTNGNNEVYCELVIDGVVRANDTRSVDNFRGIFGLLTPYFYLDNDTSHNQLLRCQRVSGTGIVTVSNAVGVGHFAVDQDNNFLPHNTSSFTTSVTNNDSYSLVNSFNLTIGNKSDTEKYYSLVVEGNAHYTNDALVNQTLNSYMYINGTTCAFFPRDVTPSETGSIPFDCAIENVTANATYQIDFYVTGNGTYDAVINAKALFLSDEEILGGTGILNGTVFSGNTPTRLFNGTGGNLNHDVANVFEKVSYSILTDGDTTIDFYVKIINGQTFQTINFSREYQNGKIGVLAGHDVLENIPIDDNYSLELWANCGTSGVNCTIVGGASLGYLTDVITTFFNGFNVSAFDYWDNSSISNFTVVDGGTWTSVNGSVFVFTQNNPENLTIYADNYFNESIFSHNTSLDLNVSLKQSDIKFEAFEIISNNSLPNATFTIDGVSMNASESFYLKAGSYNVTVSSSGYFSEVEQINVSPLDNLTYNFSLGNALVNITAIDFLSGNLVSNYTLFFNYLNGTYSNNVSTATPYLSTGLIQGYFNVTFFKNGYLQNTNTIFVNDTIFNYNLFVYGLENVSLNFFDEETLEPVNNVQFDVLGDLFSGGFNTSAGNSFLLADLPEGIYQIRYTANDYSARSYYVAIPLTSAAFVNLSLYLVNDSIDALFTRNVVGQDAIPLDGSYLEVQRPYPSEDNTSIIYRTVEIAIVDNSGDAVFSAIPNTQQYRFRILDEDLNLLNTLTPNFLIDTAGEIIADESLSTMIDYNTAYDVVGAVYFQNTTNYFILDYTAPAGVSSACLRVTNNTGYSSTYSEICSAEQTGTLAIIVDTNLSVTYEALGYVIIEGQQFAIDTDSLDLRFINEKDPLRYIGPFLYFLAIILFGAMAFIRPVIGIFGAVAVTGAFGLQFLGLMWFSTALIGGLMVLGIIIAIVAGRRS